MYEERGQHLEQKTHDVLFVRIFKDKPYYYCNVSMFLILIDG